MLDLFAREHARMALFALPQLIFRCSKISESAFPFRFQSTSDQTIVRFDRTVSAFRTLSFVTCAFDFQPPLLERGIAIGLELLECE